MSLSLRRTVGPANANGSARSTRKPVVAKAFLKDIGAGFAQIFSPLRRGNKEDWTGTEAPFTAKISHHSDARKPFKDGWETAASQGDAAGAPEPATKKAPEADGNPLSFINKAAEAVVAHNFTSDSAPESWKGSQAAPSTGWGADIHSRKREGFHAITPSPQAPSKKPAAPAKEEEPRKEFSPKESRKESSPPVMTFLAEATEQVIAHNFTGDGTEPEVWKGKGDKPSTGWKGDIHSRERDGFHNV